MLPLRLPLRVAAQSRFAPVITKSLLARRVILPIRSYATPAKPKKGSIGETAKRGRATTATPSAATKKPAAKKTAKKTATKTTAKKTGTSKAANKGPTKAALAKAAVKARAAERAAKAKAKKTELAAKKRERELKKRTLEKAKREAAQKKQAAAKAKAKAKAGEPAAKIKLLKAQALKLPVKKATSSSWIEFYTAALKQGPPITSATGGLPAAAKQAKQEFSQLSPSQKESYTRAANETKERLKKEYAAWVAGHSAEEIRLANAARAKLRSLNVKGYPPIQDDRQLKKPMTAYLRFFMERVASGQHPGTLPEVSKESGRLWKELGESQKRDYTNAYERDLAQYNKQFELQYGHPTTGVASKTAAA